jgi:hypothetical protein
MPPSEYNVLRSGFLFTVIRLPSAGLPPGLTYWNNRKVFVNKLELSESIIKSESMFDGEQHPFFKHPSWSTLPRLYFWWDVDGYELGLEVQYDWWKRLCESGEIGELGKIKTRSNQLCGTTRLVIATLPYSEFESYYQNVDYGQQKVWDKQLEAKEWKRKVVKDSEIRDPWSHVDHKYFAVSHRDI